MGRERIAESQEVENETIGVFSRVAGWTGYGAAWRVRGIMAEPFADGDVVLDVGTGPGTIPLHLQRFFPKASFYGLDISAAMLAQARRHSERMDVPLGLLSGSGEYLPFADNSLDMVLSFFTMHHINDPGAFLTEVDRVLKADGKFLLIDFRRDMPAFMYKVMNSFWQLAFLLSPGRKGLMESIDSAWTAPEIKADLVARGLKRFQVNETRTELLITSGIKKFAEG
ncbi:MAG: class I SAM-dependent methyltransferase [Proteobacteria bacterium]|nr:class I SAM-dependent methyltransferase [Pseudomonadota bacterium]MBU1639529.1 class I SAM-dependent methyltransferase [Pseudomonadota bacterium]